MKQRIHQVLGKTLELVLAIPYLGLVLPISFIVYTLAMLGFLLGGAR